MPFRGIDEAPLVLACDMFVRGEKTPAIRDAVNAEFERLHQTRRISREQVYPLLDEGRERGYFAFTPPERFGLQTRVANAFDVAANRVHVANSRSIDSVAATAATLLVELIVDLGKKHERVHVGLGGGYTTRLVASHLANQLRAIADLPKLTLHALSTGFDAKTPHTAPVTFFAFFEGVASDIEYIGLFAPPVVKTDEYPSVIAYRGVKVSFDARKSLHLVVTSLGSNLHGHGDFYEFMEQGKKRGLTVLEKAGWVGDVQYRPYSATGPITEDTDIRAVTLLELEELVAMARRRDKHVVVVAGPCGRCGATRTAAVKPLFLEPKLRLWSHFVMDMTTADELLEGS